MSEETKLHVLFLCSRNRLRSPTAEHVFASWPGIEVSSAGLERDADHPLTPELLEWADLVFVMEKTHRTKLSSRFRASLKRVRVVCLDIPDDFRFMDPQLVDLLLARVPKFLPRRRTIDDDATLVSGFLSSSFDETVRFTDEVRVRLLARYAAAEPDELATLGRELAIAALFYVESDSYQRPDRYVFADSWLREPWVGECLGRILATHPGFRYGILERLARFHGIAGV